MDTWIHSWSEGYGNTVGFQTHLKYVAYFWPLTTDFVQSSHVCSSTVLDIEIHLPFLKSFKKHPHFF